MPSCVSSTQTATCDRGLSSTSTQLNTATPCGGLATEWIWKPALRAWSTGVYDFLVTCVAVAQSLVLFSGVYDFKPYVHSDCGGDYRPSYGGDLLRWTAHCAFGSILRFHGNAHQPWSYDNHTEDVIRQYLNMRCVVAFCCPNQLRLLGCSPRGDKWAGTPTSHR